MYLSKKLSICLFVFVLCLNIYSDNSEIENFENKIKKLDDYIKANLEPKINKEIYKKLLASLKKSELKRRQKIKRLKYRNKKNQNFYYKNQINWLKKEKVSFTSSMFIKPIITKQNTRTGMVGCFQSPLKVKKIIDKNTVFAAILNKGFSVILKDIDTSNLAYGFNIPAENLYFYCIGVEKCDDKTYFVFKKINLYLYENYLKHKKLLLKYKKKLRNLKKENGIKNSKNQN